MQKRQGVSLIVLVITIIIMIILAGAILLTLKSAGIIGDAKQAVKMSNLANLKQIIDLAWSEAYADGIRTVEGAEGEEGFIDRINAALIANGYEKGLSDEALKDVVINITDKGISSVIGWKQEGLTVRKGKTVLNIGDTILYDETADGTVTDLTNVEWKVLGASEAGELLIMSTGRVTTYQMPLSSSATFETAKNTWLGWTNILNELCEPYGKGKSATGARSLNDKDVIKISDSEKVEEKIYNYNVGKIDQYGNEVTYSYHNDSRYDKTQPAYRYATKKTNTTTKHVNGFYYYNGNDIVSVDLTKFDSGDITTVTSSFYEYLLDADAEVSLYEGLFGKATCWLASTYTYTAVSGFSYGVRHLTRTNAGQGKITWQHVLKSTGDIQTSTASRNVYAVVSLSPDIELIGSSETYWTY